MVPSPSTSPSHSESARVTTRVYCPLSSGTYPTESSPTTFYIHVLKIMSTFVFTLTALRGEWNKRANVSIPVDGDFFRIEADLERSILATVDHVQVQAPLSGDNFRNNEEYVLDNVRVFIVSRLRSLRKVTFTMLAPLSVSSILVALGRTVVNLETIRLTPGDDHYPIEELQSAILYGLSRFNRMPHIILPGSFFSWDFFLRLGDLPIRDLSFDSIIPPAFLPSTVRTPRARCFELFDGSSSRVINRMQKFKHLRCLSLTAPLDLIVDMHGILAPIKSMTRFTLIIPILDAPMASTQIYRRIATLFPSLTSFHLELQRAHDLETPAWLDTPGLLAFKHLDDLSITHPFPLALDDGAVARFLHAWPLMTRLSLNPCPRILNWPPAHENGNGNGHVASLTWDVLRGTVRRNGVLKALGVYLGAQKYACASVARELSEIMDNNYVLQQLLVGTDGPMHPGSFTVLTGIFKSADVENAF